MEQAAIQASNPFYDFQMRKMKQPVVTRQSMPAQKPDTFTSIAKEPEKSFWRKNWGKLVLAAAGVFGGTILIMSGINSIKKGNVKKNVAQKLKELTEKLKKQDKKDSSWEKAETILKKIENLSEILLFL